MKGRKGKKTIFLWITQLSRQQLSTHLAMCRTMLDIHLTNPNRVKIFKNPMSLVSKKYIKWDTVVYTLIIS